MEVDIATTKDIQELKKEIAAMENRLMQAIDQIGKPKMITSSDCAAEWGVTSETAIKRLKEMYKKGQIETANFDTRPVIVDRQEFYKAISLA